MKKINPKELTSIPNLMGYFRILLIPVFVVLYLKAQTPQDYFVAAIVVGISGLTDFLDGYVARHFNQITEFGKFLDPFADKLTLGTIVICLCTRYSLLIPVAILYVVKELFMGIMGAACLKHNGQWLGGAKWYGKTCTFLTYLVMVALLVWTNIPANISTILILVDLAWMTFTLGMYIPVFIRMWKMPKKGE